MGFIKKLETRIGYHLTIDNAEGSFRSDIPFVAFSWSGVEAYHKIIGINCFT